MAHRLNTDVGVRGGDSVGGIGTVILFPSDTHTTVECHAPMGKGCPRVRRCNFFGICSWAQYRREERERRAEEERRTGGTETTGDT